MPGRLRSYVHVNDERGGRHAFGPDDEVPDWAAAKITNPKAWAQQPPELEAPGPSDVRAAGRPPKNASREIWGAYAAVRGLEVAADATRDQIIAAVEAAEQQ